MSTMLPPEVRERSPHTPQYDLRACDSYIRRAFSDSAHRPVPHEILTSRWNRRSIRDILSALVSFGFLAPLRGVKHRMKKQYVVTNLGRSAVLDDRASSVEQKKAARQVAFLKPPTFQGCGALPRTEQFCPGTT